MAVSWILAAAATAPSDYVPYGVVGAALLLLFRVVFRTLAVKDKEVWTLVRQYQAERDRANAWAEYHAGVAAYWQAVAYNAPQLPEYPKQPSAAPPPSLNVEPIPPPT